MIYIATSNLKPGMKLAREVWGASSFLPLLHSQNILTAKNIEDLAQRNVAGAYIELLGTEDTEQPEEIFTVEQKIHLTSEIKDITKNLYSSKGNIFASVKAFDKIADYMASVILENKDCMLNLVEIKNYDDYAYVHSMQVGITATIIGKKMELSETNLKSLALAGMLHDVGKLKISKEILDKPSRLTEEEFVKMKKHPAFAYQKLSQCPGISNVVLDAVACHHEKYDGSGYPYSLAGEDIPVFARIISIADVYDALTSPRTYRGAWEPHEAVNYMMSRAGTQFDTEILSTFLSCIAAYPIGVVVELDQGDVGVVVAANAGFPLNPVVKLLSPIEKYGQTIDLANDRDALTRSIISTIKDADMIAEIFNNSARVGQLPADSASVGQLPADNASVG
ncbi:MAG: HD-GYP domain-containing protein [Oscillospiraceae bacterium]